MIQNMNDFFDGLLSGFYQQLEIVRRHIKQRALAEQTNVLHN